jgi:hypothetical protein
MGANRVQIIDALNNVPLDNVNRFVECLNDHAIDHHFLVLAPGIVRNFLHRLENINELDRFLNTIEQNQKKGAAFVFMEYYSNPQLMQKSQDVFNHLRRLAFQEPMDMHLLEQIIGINGKSNRLGRHDDSLPLAKNSDDENYLMENHGTFSDTPNLGDTIKDYFKTIKRPHDGLYEYAIGGSVPIDLSKGIIIDNYGGYGGIDFSYSASIRLKELIRKEYIVIDLKTRDNWQTLFQGD